MDTKKKTLFASILFAGLLLSACGGSTQNSNSSQSIVDSPEASSIEGAASNSAEASEDEVKSVGDDKWVYYAEDLKCKLTLDYKGRDFYTDGIEKVTLNSAIDGDTAHFNSSSGNLIKSRFYGIDTPESTGQVQPYGKQASDFTKEKLNAAKTIVVSSAQTVYDTPKADSTGSRYVSLIWINTEKENAPYDELQLLNLLIVEYGYSWVKSVSDMPDYSDVFYAAENQAKSYKLKLFSGEKDPRFNYGDCIDASLLNIKEEVIANINDPSHKIIYDNAKVRVQGTVAGYANNIIYIEDFCFYYHQLVDDDGKKVYWDVFTWEQTTEATSVDPSDSSNVRSNIPVYEDVPYNKETGDYNPDMVVIPGVTGEYAGLNIFKGMSAIPSKFTTLGNYIQVCGLALDSQFGFQITDGKFKTIAYDDNDASVILYADENIDEHALKTFYYTADELSTVCRTKDYEALNCRVEITTPITITSSFDADSGAIYLYTDIGVSAYINFIYKPYPNDKAVSWTEGSKFHNHQFLFKGVLAIHETQSGNKLIYLYPGSSEDIVWVDVAPSE